MATVDVSPVVDILDVEMTKNEHIYDPGCGVTTDVSEPFLGLSVTVMTLHVVSILTSLIS